MSTSKTQEDAGSEKTAATNNTVTSTQPAQAPAKEVTLDDWCGARSQLMGHRVEGLSAFHRTCLRDGMRRAKPDAFEAAFQKFLNTPA